MRALAPQSDTTWNPHPGLRVLHVLDHSVPLQSGYSFRSLALLREQRRRGWQTIHLTTPKHTFPGADKDVVEGLTFYRTAMPSAPWPALKPLAELELIRAVAARIKEVAAHEAPHVLHAHSPVSNALAALWAARALNLPVVYEVRAFWEDAAVNLGTARDGGLRYRLTRWLETLALRRSDAVTTICLGLKEDMQARDLAGDKITLIPNGVDLSEFPRIDRGKPSETTRRLRRELDLEGKTVVGFLGSFYAYEGLDVLLAAMSQIKHTMPEIRVLLVGGGPAAGALKAQARDLGLEDCVRFVGRVPHSETRSYYELADVLVFPRLSMRLTETVTPLKPLEAMATGGIVLASDVGGHRELIRHGETGFLFRAGDPGALARALATAVARRELWDAVSAKARHYVETERTWERSAEGYEEAYATALRNHRRN